MDRYNVFQILEQRLLHYLVGYWHRLKYTQKQVISIEDDGLKFTNLTDFHKALKMHGVSRALKHH